MTSHDYKQSAYYLLYLIRCALNGKSPKKEKLDKMDLSGVFAVAKAHTLTAIAAYALSSGGVANPAFMEEKYKAIRKNITFDAERRNVLAELEKEGIWYCPLKGCIIKDWYPEIGMRQMADNDILVDGSKMSEVREIMERLEFNTKSFGNSHQDVYEKEPVYNFEIHSCLVEPRHGDAIYDYYLKIKDKLLKDEDNNFCYHFLNEDFYIYFISHEYKHFSGAGTGLRSLVDTYVINRHFSDSLDQEYLSEELQKLGVLDFERKNRQLAEKIFTGQKLDDDEKKMLDIFIFSSTYGNFKTRMNNRGVNGSLLSKAKYVVTRLSLTERDLKENHPFFYRHKTFRPLLYAKRLALKALKSPKVLRAEIRDLKNYK